MLECCGTDLQQLQRYALYTVMLALLPASAPSGAAAATAPADDACAGGPVRLEITDASGAYQRFEGLPASFGRRLPRHRAPASPAAGASSGSGDEPLSLALAPLDSRDSDACTPLGRSYPEGTALLVPRGGCDFATKARNVAAANASGLVLYDNAPGSCVLMGHNRSDVEESRALSGLAALSVSQASGEALAEALASNGTIPASAWVQPEPVFDAASMTLWALAIGTVAAGAALAGIDYQHSCMQLPMAAGAGADAESARSWAKRHGHGTGAEVVTLTAAGALLFVVMASAMLLMMFFLLSDVLYWLLVVLYCVAATQAMSHFSAALACRVLPQRWADASVKLPYVGITRCVAMAAVLVSVAIPVTWCLCQGEAWAWLLQNLMGICLMLVILRGFCLPDLKVATLLLCLCFCYDVFWVFIQPWLSGGESVMVEVATGGGSNHLLPMLLLVPHSWGSAYYAILGFGDVVLPGLLVAFVRVYDLRKGGLYAPLSRGYYLPTIIGYALGLLATYVALYYNVGGEEGQPALLYLVPSTLGTVLALAAARGQLKDMWGGQHETPHDADGVTVARGRGGGMLDDALSEADSAGAGSSSAAAIEADERSSLLPGRS